MLPGRNASGAGRLSQVSEHSDGDPQAHLDERVGRRTARPRLGSPRNQLKFLLTSLRRPAVPETEICRNGDRSPVRNWAFRSVSQHCEPQNRDWSQAPARHATLRNLAQNPTARSALAF
jgi:hypothetical protein